MMEMLTKTQIEQHLRNYYIERFGANESDIWHEQPAANVWVFQRDDQIVALKCHILTGVVTAKISNVGDCE